MSEIHALIIEDNQDGIDVLAALLKQEAITSTAVKRPTELKPADLERVSIVFLDLEMAGLTGYDVFALLRGRYGLSVPIVAYTVNTNEKATVRQLGFNGMLGKPVDAACFGSQVQRLLHGEDVWDDC